MKITKTILKQIIREEILKEGKSKMVITGKTINVDLDDVDDFAKMLDKYKIKYTFPVR